jgi:L-threonylcarbamoyladenylate synthase
LAKAVGRPITGTSANLSGAGGCSRLSHLDAAVSKKVDLILDAGSLEAGIGSTVVDVTPEGVKMIREGAVSAMDINSVIKN